MHFMPDSFYVENIFKLASKWLFCLFYFFNLNSSQVKKTGMPPGPRAGFSMCVHKKRAVLFGGVVDMEVEGYN
jgi:hypothetical protein